MPCNNMAARLVPSPITATKPLQHSFQLQCMLAAPKNVLLGPTPAWAGKHVNNGESQMQTSDQCPPPHQTSLTKHQQYSTPCISKTCNSYTYNKTGLTNYTCFLATCCWQMIRYSHSHAGRCRTTRHHSIGQSCERHAGCTCRVHTTITSIHSTASPAVTRNDVSRFQYVGPGVDGCLYTHHLSLATATCCKPHERHLHHRPRLRTSPTALTDWQGPAKQACNHSPQRLVSGRPQVAGAAPHSQRGRGVPRSPPTAHQPTCTARLDSTTRSRHR